MVCNKCVYVCGTIPRVFLYNYPNCVPQGALQAPQGKHSPGHGCRTLGKAYADHSLMNHGPI